MMMINPKPIIIQTRKWEWWEWCKWEWWSRANIVKGNPTPHCPAGPFICIIDRKMPTNSSKKANYLISSEQNWKRSPCLQLHASQTDTLPGTHPGRQDNMKTALVPISDPFQGKSSSHGGSTRQYVQKRQCAQVFCHCPWILGSITGTNVLDMKHQSGETSSNFLLCIFNMHNRKLLLVILVKHICARV